MSILSQDILDGLKTLEQAPEKPIEKTFPAESTDINKVIKEIHKGLSSTSSVAGIAFVSTFQLEAKNPVQTGLCFLVDKPL